jgi:leader peptidase (prepilin peptidase)/N-methyltransferase
MMVVIAMIGLGIVVGWAVTILADYLPRFAVEPPADRQAARPRVPALWKLVTNQRGADFRLNLAAELIAGIGFGLLPAVYGPTGNMAFLAAAFGFFLLVSVIDLKYRLVLNVMMYPAMILVGVYHVLTGTSLLHIALGGLLAFGVFYLTARLRPGDLGGGDVKLAALLGLVFGFPGILWALLVGTGLGAIVLVVRARSQPGKAYYAYAPFLCLGAMVALVYNPFILV